MPLERADYTELLRRLRANVRDALGPADDHIMFDFQGRDDPRENLLRYMSMLSEVVGLGARSEADKVLAEIRQYIRPAEGRSISEIRVLLSPAEQELYRIDHISLAGSPELDDLLAQLRHLRAEILEEGGDETDSS